MANSTLKNINYQVGKLCRLGSRKAKLMAISNRRKQQLRHLGERVYIFKALQQDEDIWEKDEISQLLLTIADLDQEQEMIIDEINEIKAETPPADTCSSCHDDEPTSETATPVATVTEEKVEISEVKPEKDTVAKAENAAEKVDSPAPSTEKAKTKPKAPRRKTAAKKTTPKKATAE